MIKIEDIVKHADKLDKVPQQGALERSRFWSSVVRHAARKIYHCDPIT
jgi:hypothetical protein